MNVICIVQARKEESNRRLLQKTKENHAKSELSWERGLTFTSVMSYHTTVDFTVRVSHTESRIDNMKNQ